MKEFFAALTVLLKIIAFIKLEGVFKRDNEIDHEITRLSVGAGESELLQIERLAKERKRNAEFIRTLQPGKHDQPAGAPVSIQ